MKHPGAPSGLSDGGGPKSVGALDGGKAVISMPSRKDTERPCEEMLGERGKREETERSSSSQFTSDIRRSRASLSCC